MHNHPSTADDLIMTRWCRSETDAILVPFRWDSTCDGFPAFCVVRGRVQPEDFNCGPFGNFHRADIRTVDDARFTFRLRASDDPARRIFFDEVFDGLYHVRARIPAPSVHEKILRSTRKLGKYIFLEQPVLNSDNEWRPLNVLDCNWKKIQTDEIALRMRGADVDVCLTLHYTVLSDSTVSMFAIVRCYALKVIVNVGHEKRNSVTIVLDSPDTAREQILTVGAEK
ncbi:hypothetical protein BDN72DRAFT_860492 [Pluteus cervinus]|uniref:Uncharacterized protein n=1 Tax=Pluteus cervinus TaxID=181527 RepID=A0ACD3AL68_9AGAR|nr:hypothetical protein BDN72DRAFT_860492 [Pluteus cervinus]